MSWKDLKKLKKEKNLQKIIYAHIHNKIYLTNNQIDSLIKERDSKGIR